MAVALAAATLGAAPPPSSRDQLDLGLSLLRSGQLQKALSPLQKAAVDPALAEEANFLLGADYFELHRPADAIQALQPLRQSLHAERVLYMLEESHRSLGHSDEAKATFHELNTRFPDGPWMHMLMASAYESQAQPEKAMDEYKAALSRDPAMANVHFAIGYLYWRAGELTEASTWLKDEAKAAPCHPLAHYYLGEIARTERDLPEAEAHYRKAISCDGNYADAHLRLGSVLSASNHSEEALKHLKLAAQLMPAQSAPHYQMAALYHRLGQNEKAEAEYQIVRALKAKAGEADEKLSR